uniref:Protein kinase domain-containing protein n=1 Tax=Vespula pensylvanica TaxID=30213 RepID=A0A834PG77_VESPE|nr:hypothetical protein H0235_001509 [Vespula pensylvanica]
MDFFKVAFVIVITVIDFSSEFAKTKVRRIHFIAVKMSTYRAEDIGANNEPSKSTMTRDLAFVILECFLSDISRLKRTPKLRHEEKRWMIEEIEIGSSTNRSIGKLDNNDSLSSHQAPTMSSTRKTSPRFQHRNLQSSSKCANSKRRGGTAERAHGEERCRGRCRVQWSEKHVKEGLVLVQETQLARVVKTGPITEHYEIDSKPFASGQWARVYRCRSRSTGTVYAAKYSSRNRFNADCSAELRHEIALLSLCSQSPRVVRLHDVYETPKEIIMVMEFAPGGDLQTLIDGDLVPLEGDVVHFVRQLVEGLAYLHERNIAHLDIKWLHYDRTEETQVNSQFFELLARTTLSASDCRIKFFAYHRTS